MDKTPANVGDLFFKKTKRAMKNIKFKAKGHYTKEWFFGLLTLDRNKRYRIQYNIYKTPIIAIPETICQLICNIPNTSIYVDNSQELYEDDIFVVDGSNTKYVAKFDGFGEYYGISNEGDEYGSYTFRLSRHNIARSKIKIIGNIHDNPELLTDSIK